MSLKAFHLLFIALSILIAVWFAAWSANAYSARGETGDLVGACVAFAVSGLLAVYAASFRRKVRREGL